MSNITERSIIEKCMLIFGFFAPAPIISFFSITAYVWFLMIVLLSILLYSFKYKLIISRKFDKIYLLYVMAVVVSTVICARRMEKDWKIDLVTLSIQFLAVLIIYVFLDGINDSKLPMAFVKGVYVSAVVQMIWGYLQIFFYFIHIDLNSLIFEKILHMYTGEASQISETWGIKVSAFCWNAGNFAPLMIFGYVFSKNIYLKLMFICISIVSGSRTLMIGMIICICTKLIRKLFVREKLSYRKCIILSTIIILMISFCLINSDMVIDKIEKSANLLNVIKNYSTEGSTNTHARYLLEVGNITEKNDLLSNLFGYGPGCSGYAFVKWFDFYSNIGKWSIECDYINCLWNYGYIGAILYYIWLLKNMIKCKKIDSNYIILFITFLIMGFMYNITFNWVLLLYIMMFVLAKEKASIFEI